MEKLAWGRRWEGDDVLLPKKIDRFSHPNQSSHALSAGNITPRQYVSGHLSSRKGIVQ